VDPPEHRGSFTFVGASRTFSDEPEFWRTGEHGLLFAFHLHGFAGLARYAAGPRAASSDAFWATVAGSWLSHAGEPSRPGWHPYPLSGRIMAWCAALSAGGWPAALEQRMLASLERQTQVLRRSVEHDIGGNHVLRNATALVFAGVCLADARLERRALTLLRRELRAQLLADGGHEERSTAYHRAVRGDVNDVAVLLTRAHGSNPGWLEEARSRMVAWEHAMRGPDGTLPLLNDAWEGPAEPVARDRDRATILHESGYVVLRHAEDQLIIDAGRVAPPHLPPHAHADVLSFVLWADGRPLIVDPGTFAYTGPQRALFRGTAAHNTVEVDASDQCDLWGDFRAAFMPRVVRLDVDRCGDRLWSSPATTGIGGLPTPSSTSAGSAGFRAMASSSSMRCMPDVRTKRRRGCTSRPGCRQPVLISLGRSPCSMTVPALTDVCCPQACGRRRWS
jgi:uncharacterized heparinase superfamily protein